MCCVFKELNTMIILSNYCLPGAGLVEKGIKMEIWMFPFLRCKTNTLRPTMGNRHQWVISPNQILNLNSEI